MATAKRKAPWDRPAPKRRRTTTLSAADKKAARARAHRAGRPYPNLVDNMSAARRTKAPTKDPRGGLTAAGRRELARRDGAHLKPGVKKAVRDMTPAEMKRKGSWARRFFGRKVLPKLVDATGRPTRFALSAAAWGEPVPRTVAAARRIAAKGERLLERYARTRAAH